MNISYNWLKEYVKFDLTPAEVEKILTSIGLEVEHYAEVEEIPGGLAGVVVAEVLECENHPDSDHLHITKVNAGTGEPLQIVCGAPNVAKGQKVTYPQVLKDIQQRDYQDTHRQIAPLKMAKDSVKVDTSELDVDGVIAAIREIVQEKISV